MLRTTTETQVALAIKYGVSYKTISAINQGKTYIDLDIDYPIRTRNYKQRR